MIRGITVPTNSLKKLRCAAGGVLALGGLLAPSARSQQQYPPGTIVIPGNGGGMQTVPNYPSAQQGRGNRNGNGRRNRGNGSNGGSGQAPNANGNGFPNGMNGGANGRTRMPRMPQKTYEFVAGGIISSAPAVGSDGLIYVGSWNNKVYGLDAKTGQAKWSFTTGRLINASPAVGPDGTVFAGSYDHKLYALDGKTGAKKWEFVTGDIVNRAPAVGAQNVVYVGSQDHKLYALDGATGAKKWEFATGAAVSAPVLGGDGTVYVGADGVYALDAATGKPKWSFPTDYDPEAPISLGPDGTVYAAARGGTLFALDGATGARKWSAKFAGAIQWAPVVSGGRLYVGADRLYALRAADGRPVWNFGDGLASWSTPTVAPNGALYVGSSNKMVYSLSAASGTKNWAFKTDDPLLSFPKFGPDNALYVASQGNLKVYALNSRTGEALWQFTQDPVPTPPATPATAGGRRRGG